MSEDLRKQINKTLSKYSTDQLTDKLSKGLLIGMSKLVAEEILQKRSEKTISTSKTIIEYNSKVDDDSEVEEVISRSIEEVETIEEVKSPKAIKIPVEKKDKDGVIVKAKKERTIVNSNNNEDRQEIKDILSQEASKSQKIKDLSRLGLTINEISKLPTLSAHYSFIRTVVSNIDK